MAAGAFLGLSKISVDKLRSFTFERYTRGGQDPAIRVDFATDSRFAVSAPRTSMVHNKFSKRYQHDATPNARSVLQ